MKAEQFDHYVRAQFENDAVAPPARLESAVFADLEGQQRSRKGMLGAAALVLTVASSAALWTATRPVAEADAPVPQPSVETTLVEEPAAPVSSIEQVSVKPVLPVETTQPKSAQVESTPAVTARTAQTATAETEAPGLLETVGTRTIDGVSVDSGMSAPELQQKDKETWVLPAVVKVND